MLPSQLGARSFDGYPPEARQLLSSHTAVLRQLPLTFLPLLLREAIEYDWKFPAERRDLESQISYLAGLSPEETRELMAGFAELHLSSKLEHMDWVNAPRQFSEQLTAYFWATHLIDKFRECALAYGQKMDEITPPEPAPIPRLGLVAIGKGSAENKYPLFRKLRPWGVYFKKVAPDNGCDKLMRALAARANAHPVPFGHWYIDGAASEPIPSPAITCASYRALDPFRRRILAEMQKAIQTGSGPEALRTRLAQMRPSDVGMNDTAKNATLNRFQLSVLTEGSGTQLFSTTFVQWSAREALRRARPLTVLARFTPRQRERSMNELIAKPDNNPDLDPDGSLIDADMGAYYTWINLQRLPGAERSSFLVWFEDHNEALAIGPSLPRGTESSSPMTMERLLQEIA